MAKVQVNAKRCKGCFLCVSVCPTNALAVSKELGEKGNEIVKAEPEECVGCGSCYKICPDCAIEIVE